MSDNKKKILEMLAKNKINADEAYRLLSAVDAKEGGRKDTRSDNASDRDYDAKTKLKYLRVTILPGEHNADPEHAERVNVRVPMALIRAGIKLTSLIPPEALDKANQALNEKGINFDVRNIKPEDLEGLIEALGDTEIDIEGSKGEKVKVFVE
ncbi:MAG: SHOCT-like domain-containing protein [Dehalococcoidales bacterium]